MICNAHDYFFVLVQQVEHSFLGRTFVGEELALAPLLGKRIQVELKIAADFVVEREEIAPKLAATASFVEEWSKQIGEPQGRTSQWESRRKSMGALQAYFAGTQPEVVGSQCCTTVVLERVHANSMKVKSWNCCTR